MAFRVPPWPRRARAAESPQTFNFPQSNMSNIAPLRIGILNGDDIGHEIVPASVAVARAAAEKHGLAIDWQSLPIGRTALDTHGHTLPPSTLEALHMLDGWILG